MKFLFFALFFIVSMLHSELDSPSIEYTIGFEDIQNYRLSITCEFTGSETGKTTLSLPNKHAKESSLYKFVKNLTCTNAFLQEGEVPFEKKILHKPLQRLVLKYQIQLQTTSPNKSDRFKPFGNSSHFYGTGHALFVFPKHLIEKIPVFLNWKNLPENWQLANSFGTQTTHQRLYCYPDFLKSGAYLAGDYQIIDSSIGSQKLTFAIKGDYLFNIEEFTALASSVVTAERNFWQDHDFPYYLISVTPFASRGYLAGTAYTQNFSLFLGEMPVNFSKEDYLNALTLLIAHEYFHEWNAQKISPLLKDHSLCWFTEGFTDYFARKICCDHLLISDLFFDKEVKRIFSEYSSLPSRNAPNEAIVKGFWTDPNLYRLPYRRGFLLALHLDRKIQKRNPDLSLDHFMLDLKKWTEREKKEYTLGDLLDILSTYLDTEEIEATKQYIIEGKTIPIFGFKQTEHKE